MEKHLAVILLNVVQGRWETWFCNPSQAKDKSSQELSKPLHKWAQRTSVTIVNQNQRSSPFPSLSYLGVNRQELVSQKAGEEWGLTREDTDLSSVSSKPGAMPG